MKLYLTVIAIPFLLFAQQLPETPEADSAKIYPVKEVIVSATRTKKSLDEIGRSVNVISAQVINNSLTNSIGELIGQQSGLYVVGAGQNPGMTQTIFTRGASSNHTAIMVDGVRVSDPSTVNNAPDLSELSPLGIDRLEIVRGSQSTLFGSSAIGGVINLITKNSGVHGIHVDADATAGTFGEKTSLQNEELLLQYSEPGGLYAIGGVSRENVKGLDATVDTVTNNQLFKNRDQDGFTKTDLFSKVGFENELMEFHLSYKINSQRTDIDKSAFVDDNNYVLDFHRRLLTYGASVVLDGHTIVRYIGGVTSMNRSSVNDSSRIDAVGNYDHTYVSSSYEGSASTNEIQADIQFSGVDGIIGAGLYGEHMNNTTHFFTWSPFGVFTSDTDLDTLDLHSTTKSLFAHANISGSVISQSLQLLSLAIGGRMNHHSVFGSNFTYEINPSLKLFENSMLFISYSTGYNAPSLYQLYAPDTYYTSTIKRGNTQLKPEQSSSYEIGWKQSLSSKINLSLTYFNTTVDHSIEYVYLWDKNVRIDTLGNDFLRDDYRGDTYLNLGTQLTNGFEFTVNAQLSDQLFISANASYVTGKLTYQSSDINSIQTGGQHVQIYSTGAFLTDKVETKKLVRRPNTANIHMGYLPWRSLLLSIDVKVVGPRDDVFYEATLGPYGALGNVNVGEYTLVDLSQKFTVLDNLVLSGRVENIFNRKYSEIKGFTTRGRGIFVKLSYDL